MAMDFFSTKLAWPVRMSARDCISCSMLQPESCTLCSAWLIGTVSSMLSNSKLCIIQRKNLPCVASILFIFFIQGCRHRLPVIEKIKPVIWRQTSIAVQQFGIASNRHFHGLIALASRRFGEISQCLEMYLVAVISHIQPDHKYHRTP